MGTSNFVEDVSLSVKLERLKHHLLHPGAPGYIHQLSTKKVNAMQWQQMSAQWGCYDAGFRVAEIGSRGMFLWGFLRICSSDFTWNFFLTCDPNPDYIDYYRWLQMIIDALWCYLKFDPPSSWSKWWNRAFHLFAGPHGAQMENLRLQQIAAMQSAVINTMSQDCRSRMDEERRFR